MKRFVTFVRRLFLLAVLAGGVYAAAQVPFQRTALPPRDGLALTGARTWGYQLQNARPDRIATGVDLLVIDAQRQTASPMRPLSQDDVSRFRTKPDGSQRIVLAYMSVGEAESYRTYWWSHWRVLGPSWLGKENKAWKTNYYVRFWEPGWRRIIVNSNPSLLDRGIDLIWPTNKPMIDQILDAGFDGVYLDRVDAFDDWKSERPGAEEAMMAFVAEISDYAKRRRPGFLIVPQNGEELLRNVSYRRKIDGVAKEDLLFGTDHKAGANAPDVVTESIRLLNMARADRLPVFVVEYLAAPEKRAQAATRIRSLSYVLHFADRALGLPPELNTMSEPPASPPATPPPATPSAVKPKG